MNSTGFVGSHAAAGRGAASAHVANASTVIDGDEQAFISMVIPPRWWRVELASRCREPCPFDFPGAYFTPLITANATRPLPLLGPPHDKIGEAVRDAGKDADQDDGDEHQRDERHHAPDDV